MTEKQLKEIEARCSKATEGPWEWRGKSASLHTLHDRGEYQYGKAVMAPTYEYDSGVQLNVADADEEFIAHSRTDVPALIAEVRRLREALVPFAARARFDSFRPDLADDELFPVRVCDIRHAHRIITSKENPTGGVVAC